MFFKTQEALPGPRRTSLQRNIQPRTLFTFTFATFVAIRVPFLLAGLGHLFHTGKDGIPLLWKHSVSPLSLPLSSLSRLRRLPPYMYCTVSAGSSWHAPRATVQPVVCSPRFCTSCSCLPSPSMQEAFSLLPRFLHIFRFRSWSQNVTTFAYGTICKLYKKQYKSKLFFCY